MGIKRKEPETVSLAIMDSREEWLSTRNGIGGSDAAAVIGLNPWKTNQQLFLEKTGQAEPHDIGDNPAVEYGTKAEPLIRELFILDHPEMRVAYAPNNIFRNSKYPFAHASLDGWMTDGDGRRGVLEIKTATISSAVQARKWKDSIPDNYYCQCLWYMGVTEMEFVILRAHLKRASIDHEWTEIKDYKMERREVEEDIRYLMDKGAEFWKCVETGRMPDLILPEL